MKIRSYGDKNYFSIRSIVIHTPSGKGGPALGDRALLAIAASQRQMGIAELIAAMSFPTAVTIDVIVIYLVVTILATNLYTNWCKKQLVMQAKP